MTAAYIDFKELKGRTSIEDVAHMLNLAVKRKGNELRSGCPACKRGDDRVLSVTTDWPNKDGSVGRFTCWNDKDKFTGDMIAFAAHVRGVSNREAALFIAEHIGFTITAAPSKAHSAPSPAKAEPDGRRGFSPLGYLEASHPVAEMLGLSAATLDALGGGYAPKGTMIGRLLIPLRMESGRLVGYVGIATKEEHAPLLLFPDNLEQRCLDEPVSEPPKEEATPEPATPSPDALRKLFRVVA